MNTEVKTPPHRKNPDWYRVKFRLASTLSNEAADQKTISSAGFVAAGAEIDELLQVCWPMLKPSPLELLLKRNHEVREFVIQTVMPASLVLKALIELGLNDCDPGEDEYLPVPTVRRRLRKGEAVPPLTIVEAVIRQKRERGPNLLLDFACFFALSKRRVDNERAKGYVDQAFAKLSAAEQEVMRARAAADPMLKRVPGIAAPSGPDAKRLCNWKKQPPEEQRKPRPWF